MDMYPRNHRDLNCNYGEIGDVQELTFTLQDILARNKAILREVNRAKDLVDQHRFHQNNDIQTKPISASTSQERLFLVRQDFMQVVESVTQRQREADLSPQTMVIIRSDGRNNPQQARAEGTGSTDTKTPFRELFNNDEIVQHEQLWTHQSSFTPLKNMQGTEEICLSAFDLPASMPSPAETKKFPATPSPRRPDAWMDAISVPHALGKQHKDSMTADSPDHSKNYDGVGVREVGGANYPDIRNMTAEERFTVAVNLIRLIENLSYAVASSTRAALPRSGYPAVWDGRIPSRVLKFEQRMYQDLKSNVLQEKCSSILQSRSPGGASQCFVTTCCLAFLHLLRFSSRELLPLHLLEGVMEEAKLSKHHRHVRHAAGLWMAFRDHLRFLLYQKLMTPEEIRDIFAEALLGDMSKRGKGEVLRKRRKIMLLLESIIQGLAAQKDNQARHHVRTETQKETTVEKCGTSVSAGRFRGVRPMSKPLLDEKSYEFPGKTVTAGIFPNLNSSATRRLPTCSTPHGKRNFISRLLRWK